MIGTVVNALAIVAGGAVGLLVTRFSRKAAQGESKVIESVRQVLGLATVILGVQMALAEHEFLPVLVSLAVGTAFGELINIEKQVDRFGTFLKRISRSRSENFVSGFVNASVLYCVGAAAVVGSLRDGLLNDPSLLYVKSLLDGVFSIIFAGAMGVGVLFSAIPVLIYQGLITLGASKLAFMLDNDVYINGLSVAGGILVMAIGLNITGITRLRVGNMLPALVLIPLIDKLLTIIN
jgi:uncharacterized membrane protein YqgA involved in biofilm formation